MLANLIIETIFGALAGYVTNDVAIKTLFKPGGTIEKNREHFTGEISALLEKEVLTAEDLAQILTSSEVTAAISEAIDHLLTVEVPLFWQNITLNQLDNGCFQDLLCRYSAKMQQDSQFKQLLTAAIVQSLPNEVLKELKQALNSAAENSFKQHAPLNIFLNSASPLLEIKSVYLLEEYLNQQAENLASKISADKEIKTLIQQLLLSSPLPVLMEQSIDYLLKRSLNDYLTTDTTTAFDTINNYLHTPQGQELLYAYGEKIHHAFASSSLTIEELLTLPPVRSIILPVITKQWPLVCSIFLQWLSANKPLLTTMIDQAINEALNEQEGISSLISKILHDFLGDGERFSSEFLQKAQEFLLENLEAEQILNILLQANLPFKQITLAQLTEKFSPQQIQGLLNSLIPSLISAPALENLLSFPLKTFINLPKMDCSAQIQQLLDFFWQPNYIESALKHLFKMLIAALTEQSPKEILNQLNLSAAEIKEKLEAKLTRAIDSLSAEELIGALIDLLLTNTPVLTQKLSQTPLIDFYHIFFTENIRQALLPTFTANLQTLLINQMPGKLSPLAYESLSSLTNEEMLALVREFMGKELKPLNYLGASMGGAVGLVTGAGLSLLPAQSLQGLYLGGKLAVFGAVGYITNCAAIKGLFWPYKPLGGIRAIQGVIPKRQDAFARSLGQLFDSYVLNPKRLAEILQDKKAALAQILQENILLDEQQCADIISRLPHQLIKYCPQTSAFSLKDFNFDFLTSGSENTAESLRQKISVYISAGGKNILNEQSISLVLEKSAPYLSAYCGKALAPKCGKEIFSLSQEEQCLAYLLSQIEQSITPSVAEKISSQLNTALASVSPAMLCPKANHLPDKLIITLLDFLCAYLKEHQEQLTLFAQQLIKSRLNMLQTFGYLAMNGDFLLANILSRFLQIKFPLFCGLKAQQLKEAAEQYFQNLLTANLAESGFYLSGDFCYWVLSANTAKAIRQITGQNLWQSALNIPVASLCQSHAVKTLLPAWQGYFKTTLPKLSLLAAPFAQYGQIIDLSQLSASLSQPAKEALRQDIHQFIQDFWQDISAKSLSQMLPGLNIQQASEKILAHLQNSPQPQQINKRLSQDLALYLPEIAEPLSQLAVNIFLSGANAYGDVLAKMHLCEHIAAKTAQIDPKYLEQMVRSFAQDYFTHIQNMGWWGGVFALGGVLFNLLF